MHAYFKLSVAWFCMMALTVPRLLADESPKKGIVPDARAQTAAMKVVKEIYGEDYAAAKTSAEKQALAKKLLEKAKDTGEDVSARFVLLRLSRDIAAQAADLETSLQAVDEMDQSFQLDALEMKGAVLDQVAEAARLPESHKFVAEKAIAFLDDALAKDRFADARRLVGLAQREATTAKEKSLIQQISQRTAEIEEVAKAYEGVQAANATLATAPDDPKANLTAGKYKCFVKGDWEGGLRMLALGCDQQLKTLAKQELDGAASSSEQAKLGDGWWRLADAEVGRSKTQIQARAAYWYRQALPSLSGLAKDKAEKRLADVDLVSSGDAADKHASGKWLDVLPRVNIVKDRTRGNWALIRGRLAPDGTAGIMLPVTIDGSYDMTVEFTRLSCKDGVIVIFPVGTSRCFLAIGGWGGKVSGLHSVDGKEGDNNETTRRNDLFAVKRNYSLLLKVRLQGESASVETLLNGAAFVHWTGKPSSLQLISDWDLPQPKRPGLGSFDSVYFQSVKVRAVSGNVDFATR